MLHSIFISLVKTVKLNALNRLKHYKCLKTQTFQPNHRQWSESQPYGVRSPAQNKSLILTLQLLWFLLIYDSLCVRGSRGRQQQQKNTQIRLFKPVFSKNLNNAALLWPPISGFNKYFKVISPSHFFLISSNNLTMSSMYLPQYMMTYSTLSLSPHQSQRPVGCLAITSLFY